MANMSVIFPCVGFQAKKATVWCLSEARIPANHHETAAVHMWTLLKKKRQLLMYVINKFSKCQDSFIRMNNNHEATGMFKSLPSGKEVKDQILPLGMHGSQMYSQIKYSSQSDVRCGVSFAPSHICFNAGTPWSHRKNAFDSSDSYILWYCAHCVQWFLSTPCGLVKPK